MSILRPALKRWWKDDRKIPYIFASYGLAAGIMTSAQSLYDDSNFIYLVLQLNFPAMLIMLYTEWNVANPLWFSVLGKLPRHHWQKETRYSTTLSSRTSR